MAERTGPEPEERSAEEEARKEAGDGDPRMDWAPVVAVPEEIEASLAAGFLENEGIQCVVESRYFSQEPTNLSVLGEFVLFVHEDALERARRLLEDRLELATEEGEPRKLDSLLAEDDEGDHTDR